MICHQQFFEKFVLASDDFRFGSKYSFDWRKYVSITFQVWRINGERTDLSSLFISVCVEALFFCCCFSNPFCRWLPLVNQVKKITKSYFSGKPPQKQQSWNQNLDSFVHQMYNESNQISQIPFISKILEKFIQMKISSNKRQRKSIQEKVAQFTDKI